MGCIIRRISACVQVKFLKCFFFLFVSNYLLKLQKSKFSVASYISPVAFSLVRSEFHTKMILQYGTSMHIGLHSLTVARRITLDLHTAGSLGDNIIYLNQLRENRLLLFCSRHFRLKHRARTLHHG